MHIYLGYFRVIEELTKVINTESSPITLESGNVSLKNVGSHDKRVKKVLAEQRCVIITALEKDKEAIKPLRVKQCTLSFIVIIDILMSW